MPNSKSVSVVSGPSLEANSSNSGSVGVLWLSAAINVGSSPLDCRSHRSNNWVVSEASLAAAGAGNGRKRFRQRWIGTASGEGQIEYEVDGLARLARRAVGHDAYLYAEQS